MSLTGACSLLIVELKLASIASAVLLTDLASPSTATDKATALVTASRFAPVNG